MSNLRTRMHDVADAVEPLPVDDDLWQRGVAARRRGQALVIAAVVAIIASVTWSAVLLGNDDREARTASGEVVGGGAIPRSIVDPGELDLELDLAVGRASAAFVSGSDDLVVITATDGVPHRLALPAWDASEPALALSADGHFLAYQQAANDGTRIAVLDLETGLRPTILVHAGDKLKLDAISWSPRGQWLGWAASAVATTPSYVGRIRPDGDGAWRTEPDFNAVGAAVADDGTIALGSAGGALFIRSGTQQLEPAPVEVRSAPAAFSPDNAFLALATAPDRASYTLDVVTGRQLSHPFPSGTIDDAVVRPLGWLDDRLQLLLVQDATGGELVVTTPEVDLTSTWRRSVGQVEGTIMSSVSLAVDLVPDLDGTSSQQLTYDFPAPAGRDISWIIGLGVAAAIAVLLALRWLWLRLLG